MLVFTNRGEVSKIAAGSRSLTAISHFDLHTSQLAQPNQYLTRQGFSPPTHHSQPLFRVVQPCTLSTTMEPAAVPGPGPVEALVSTPVPRGTPVTMTPLQPTPLSAEDTPDLLLREGLLEPVLCPVFRQLDAEANVPEGTVSATCTARILTGPKRGKVCGKPTKAGHLCGLHGPTRNRKRQQKRNAPIDGVDVAALGLPLVSKKAEQCRFMCPGAAGRPDVQCQRMTRDPSNVCHCHRNAGPRKTRKYTHVPVALRERRFRPLLQTASPMPRPHAGSAYHGKLYTTSCVTTSSPARQLEQAAIQSRPTRKLQRRWSLSFGSRCGRRSFVLTARGATPR